MATVIFFHGNVHGLVKECEILVDGQIEMESVKGA